jgi:hypothetical protein
MDLLESLEKGKNFGGNTLRALENFTAANLNDNRSKLEKMFRVNFNKENNYFPRNFMLILWLILTNGFSNCQKQLPLKWLSFEGNFYNLFQNQSN